MAFKKLVRKEPTLANTFNDWRNQGGYKNKTVMVQDELNPYKITYTEDGTIYTPNLVESKVSAKEQYRSSLAQINSSVKYKGLRNTFMDLYVSSGYDAKSVENFASKSWSYRSKTEEDMSGMNLMFRAKAYTQRLAGNINDSSSESLEASGEAIYNAPVEKQGGVVIGEATNVKNRRQEIETITGYDVANESGLGF